jgi:hypothetical protein
MIIHCLKEQPELSRNVKEDQKILKKRVAIILSGH